MSKYRITLDGKTYEMEVELVDGKKTPLSVEKEKKADSLQVKTSSTIASPTLESSNVIKSPMPGTIIQVFLGVGDEVKQGQAVLVLEAMKMENEIASPRDGKISALFVSKGYTVQGGAALFEIE